jgi:hypothetical protein
VDVPNEESRLPLFKLAAVFALGLKLSKNPLCAARNDAVECFKSSWRRKWTSPLG